MCQMCDDQMAKLGVHLRNRRCQLGLSQDELSKRIQKPRTAISKIEQGQQRISVDDFISYCKVLDISAHTVLINVQLEAMSSKSNEAKVLRTIRRLAEELG